MKKFLVLVALFVTTPVSAELLSTDELLEPDQAFRLSTRVIDTDTVEAYWDIAEGYYLYRDKFKFERIAGATTVGAPDLPSGKIKQDPLFGKVEIYFKSVRARLPLTRIGPEAETLTLKIGYQGCNDPVGLCYAPITKKVTFDLPAAAAAERSAGPAAKNDSLDALNKLVGGTSGLDREFLHPDQAFGLDVTSTDDRTLQVLFRVTKGYYLYRDKIKFALKDTTGGPAAGVRLGAYKLPRGKIKKDEFFGKNEVYYNSLSIKLPVKASRRAAMTAVLHTSYQGCAIDGICYAPITKKINLSLTENGDISLATAGPATSPASVPTPVEPDTNQSKTSIAGFWIVVITAFGIGLALTFTPCVLPMIPILSSVIVEEGGKDITKLKGGMLSGSYVLGTAVTYTVAGALAGATGEQLQAYFQNIWAIGILSGVFVVMALSMFGFYELQIPAFVQSRLHVHTRKFKGGSFIGVFILGAISALIVGACVSPLLISVLSSAIASQDPVLGAATMFSMALGMGVFLIAIGVGAGFLLPKAGPWMERVKQVFGVLLLAVAVYLLGFLPEVPVLYLWAALLIVTAIYLGATQTLPKGASGWRYLSKGAGTVMLVWGVVALLGAFTGNRDILRPISLPDTFRTAGPGAVAPQPTGVETVSRVFERIASVAELDERLAVARTAGKPVILDYYADWCVDCLRMEKSTFSDPRVQQLMRNQFVSLQVDVTDPNDPKTKAIKRRYGVYGPPAILFFAANGAQRKDLNFYGYKSVKEFLEVLEQI